MEYAEKIIKSIKKNSSYSEFNDFYNSNSIDQKLNTKK